MTNNSLCYNFSVIKDVKVKSFKNVEEFLKART
jgi:hypothetical protein